MSVALATIFHDPTPYVRCQRGHEWPESWGDECRRCAALERIAELEHAWESCDDDTDPAVMRERLHEFVKALNGYLTGPLGELLDREAFRNEADRHAVLCAELRRLERVAAAPELEASRA